MDTREFVETRTKRYMAQALEEFEEKLEKPLRALLADDDSREAQAVVDGIEPVKRTFRKKIQALASDCTDVMPSDLHINGYEPLLARSHA